MRRLARVIHPAKQAQTILLTWLAVALICPTLSFGQKLKVGEPAPDFAVAMLDGQKTVRLSDFRGQRVLVFTWASW